MMIPVRVFFGILLAALVAWPAWSQEQSGPLPPAFAIQGDQAPPAGPPASTAPHPMRIRIGGNVQAPNLIHQVPPDYPPIAKVAQVSGAVVLHVIISNDGTVQKLDVVSGPPLLLQAATDAVKQWRYRPTLLNGQPVEVDTTVQVVFTLDSAQQMQDQAPSTTGTIDPQFKADILNLLDVLHVKKKTADMGRLVFDAMRPTLLASLPPTPNREQIADSFADRVVALFDTPEFLDNSVALYAKYFSDDDIKAALAFYQTPAGQHFDAASLLIAAEASQAGQKLARENMPGIFRGLCNDFPELKGTAGFCPNDDKDKKGLLIEPGAETETTTAANLSAW
jgi:TonB family protein